VLALSTSNRFLRASERMRAIATRYHEAPHRRGARAARQADRARRAAGGDAAQRSARGLRRHRELREREPDLDPRGGRGGPRPLRAAFTFLAGLALVAGVVGAAGMVWACVNLLGATRLALLNMSEEAAQIHQRELERASSPSPPTHP